jgi:hypothetical protein
MPRRPLVLAALAALALPSAPAAAQAAAGDALAAAVAPLVAAARRAPAADRPFQPSARFDRPLDPEAAPAFYVVRADEPVRDEPEAATRPTDRLRFRTGVRVLAVEGPWALVSYGQARGYVATEALSNVWLRVDKSDDAVYVYRGAELLRILPADGAMSEEDKTARSSRDNQDEWRTPEGTYWIGRRNPSSQYHLAFVLSYPNRHDALEGARQGIISEAQYEAIVAADMENRMPPQGTPLGGLIEIHGHGSGRQRAWTRGCIALRNVHMDWLWELVPVGAPVVIER